MIIITPRCCGKTFLAQTFNHVFIDSDHLQTWPGLALHRKQTPQDQRDYELAEAIRIQERRTPHLKILTSLARPDLFPADAIWLPDETEHLLRLEQRLKASHKPELRAAPTRAELFENRRTLVALAELWTLPIVVAFAQSETSHPYLARKPGAISDSGNGRRSSRRNQS